MQLVEALISLMPFNDWVQLGYLFEEEFDHVIDQKKVLSQINKDDPHDYTELAQIQDLATTCMAI